MKSVEIAKTVKKSPDFAQTKTNRFVWVCRFWNKFSGPILSTIRRFHSQCRGVGESRKKLPPKLPPKMLSILSVLVKLYHVTQKLSLFDCSTAVCVTYLFVSVLLRLCRFRFVSLVSVPFVSVPFVSVASYSLPSPRIRLGLLSLSVCVVWGTRLPLLSRLCHKRNLDDSVMGNIDAST